MKTWVKIFLGFVAFLVCICLLSWGFGWFDVFQTKTVGKAQQNAEREVFEQTQSYVQGMRQQLIKYHHEWMNADKDSKLAIEATIRINFASFNEDKYLEDFPDLYNFLKNVKNK